MLFFVSNGMVLYLILLFWRSEEVFVVRVKELLVDCDELFGIAFGMILLVLVFSNLHI